jgi:hypothetical protein
VKAHATPAEKETALHNAFLAHVFGNSDKLLPFRNFAASRRRVLLPGGPYSPECVRTKSPTTPSSCCRTRRCSGILTTGTPRSRSQPSDLLEVGIRGLHIFRLAHLT